MQNGRLHPTWEPVRAFDLTAYLVGPEGGGGGGLLPLGGEGPGALQGDEAGEVGHGGRGGDGGGVGEEELRLELAREMDG